MVVSLPQSNLKKFVFLFLGVIILVPALIFLVLSVIDTTNPQRSLRLEAIVRLGLPRNEKIVKTLTSGMSKVLTPAQPTELEFYCLDQQTLSPKAGYECRITGTLIRKEGNLWELETKNFQTLILDVSGGRNKIYIFEIVVDTDKQTGEQKIFYPLLSLDDFKEGELISTGWLCQAKPEKMFSKDNLIKEEFLSAIPRFIAKQGEPK